MPEEISKEIADIAATGCEKHYLNYELAAKFIKQNVEKRLGPPWNVVVGEAFSYDVQHLIGCHLLVYTNGKIACLIWKAPDEIFK